VSLLLVTDNLEKDGEKMNVNKSGKQIRATFRTINLIEITRLNRVQ